MKTKEHNKKNYTYDLTPIFECLNGCPQCKGTYFSISFNDFSNCKCNCHNKKDSVRLTTDNERIPGSTAFLEESLKCVKDRGDPNVYL